jgi:hypothetical protein
MHIAICVPSLVEIGYLATAIISFPQQRESTTLPWEIDA